MRMLGASQPSDFWSPFGIWDIGCSSRMRTRSPTYTAGQSLPRLESWGPGALSGGGRSRQGLARGSCISRAEASCVVVELGVQRYWQGGPQWGPKEIKKISKSKCDLKY